MGSKPSSENLKVSSPSNIAFIKYWGKYGVQLPMNPSLSMTLENCRTEFEVSFCEGDENIELFFEGQKNLQFEQKLLKHYQALAEKYPELGQRSFTIKSSNTFPHSAGIASSASAMSAFALVLATVAGRASDLEFVSELARLCSGSASRSLFSDYSIWGQSDFVKGSSQNFAISFDDFHKDFANMHDSIVIIDSGEKSVSSSAGHSLMSQHPYREGRVKQAQNNFKDILQALKHGDMEAFGDILENEAMSLHALMLSSKPSYVLLKPLSLKLIEELKDYRQTRKLPIYYTIDAGPNIHIIYPDSVSDKASEFIDNFCRESNVSVIHDKIGKGPRVNVI